MKKTKKKLIYGLGITSLAVAPIAVATSCGESSSENNKIDTSSYSFPTQQEFIDGLTGNEGTTTSNFSIKVPPKGTTIFYSFKGGSWHEATDLRNLPNNMATGDILKLKLMATDSHKLVTDDHETSYTVNTREKIIDVAQILALENAIKFDGHNGSGHVHLDTLRTLPPGVDAYALYQDANQDPDVPPAENNPNWVKFNSVSPQITNLANGKIIWIWAKPQSGWSFNGELPIRPITVSGLTTTSTAIDLTGLTIPSDLTSRTNTDGTSYYFDPNDEDASLRFKTDKFIEFKNSIINSVPSASRSKIEVRFSLQISTSTPGEFPPDITFVNTQPVYNGVRAEQGYHIYLKIFKKNSGDTFSGATTENLQKVYDTNDIAGLPALIIFKYYPTH